MPVIQFPYGKETLSIDIPQERLSAVLTSEMHDYKPELSQEELVCQALEHPIGTPKLSVMAEGKKKVVVIASDHTRPVPSKIIMPQMLAEIRKGNPDADITILISTGCHRETTRRSSSTSSVPRSWRRRRSWSTTATIPLRSAWASCPLAAS